MVNDERLAEIRAEVPFWTPRNGKMSWRQQAIIDLLARLDAVKKQRDAARMEREVDQREIRSLVLEVEAAEADAENLAQAAREFIATTSVFQQRKVSREAFEQLAALAARETK